MTCDSTARSSPRPFVWKKIDTLQWFLSGCCIPFVELKIEDQHGTTDTDKKHEKAQLQWVKQCAFGYDY